MGLRSALLTVQVGSQHHLMPQRSGAWGIAVLTVGLALLTYGTISLVRRLQWRSEASWAQGQVVAHEPRQAGRGRAALRPVIQFDADGTTVLFRAETGGRRTWTVGEAVNVLYDRADPHRAGVDDAHPLSWALILGIGVIGIFAAVVSA